MKHWDEMSAGWHEQYERGRPGYPDAVADVPRLPGTATVLELGAGTGKLTRTLVGRFAGVVAVEPDPGMRRWFTAMCPEGRLLAGTAEALPLADTSIDGVFSAEAFHWFDHERALAEIARVLRPGGALALLWNRPNGSVEPPIGVVEALLEPLWPDDVGMPLDLDPRRMAHARDWPRAFEHAPFEPFRQAQFSNVRSVDPDGLVAFFASMGWIGELPDEQRLALLAEIRSCLTAAEYRLPFETHVEWTRRTEPGAR